MLFLRWLKYASAGHAARLTGEIMTTVGMLYPGHSAEDEYPYLESILGEDIKQPVVHTSVGGHDEITKHEDKALLDHGNS
jgi:hypothetical protein